MDGIWELMASGAFYLVFLLFGGLFLFLFCLASPRSMWDLSSPTRDIGPAPPAVEAQSPNHWTSREVPSDAL